MLTDQQSYNQSSNTNLAQTKSGLFAGASPKLTFIFGIVVGVATISLAGFALAASYGLSAKLGTGDRSVNNTLTQAADTTIPTGSQPPAVPRKVDIVIKPDDHIRGAKDASVTLVEYSDLECPFCKRFHTPMQQLLQEYGSGVRWVYRHFPLSFHANAQKEAEATECAGKLGGNDAFWAYVDKIFERTTSNGTGFALEALVPLAKELGLDEGKFKACLENGEFAAHVQQDLQEGTAFGVSGTPTTFVNGQPVEGAVPYDQLKAVVQDLF